MWVDVFHRQHCHPLIPHLLLTPPTPPTFYNLSSPYTLSPLFRKLWLSICLKIWSISDSCYTKFLWNLKKKIWQVLFELWVIEKSACSCPSLCDHHVVLLPFWCCLKIRLYMWSVGTNVKSDKLKKSAKDFLCYHTNKISVWGSRAPVPQPYIFPVWGIEQPKSWKGNLRYLGSFRRSGNM